MTLDITQPLQTRNGMPVTLLAQFEQYGVKQIAVLITASSNYQHVRTHLIDGKYRPTEIEDEHPWDIVNGPCDYDFYMEGGC